MFEQCVLDNPVFLLGLDEFYRHAMKRQERTELLIRARRVACETSAHSREHADECVSPIRHYQWGICRSANSELAVQEFWSSQMWTAAAYRGSLVRVVAVTF